LDSFDRRSHHLRWLFLPAHRLPSRPAPLRQPRRWVDIGGKCRLYLLEKGTGGPTVLFEAGIAATNLNWFHIQEIVARFNHTASYDRGGLGWSSPSRTARTPGNIAHELHSMLQHAGIKPPYILVGHSFGGLVMRRYALLYPEDVASVLLVDPMRCEEWPPMARPSSPSSIAARSYRAMRFQLRASASPALRHFPALPVGPHFKSARRCCRRRRTSCAGRVTDEVGKMPREVWPIVAAHWSRPSYYVGMSDHVEAVPDTVREMKDAEPIRGIPVTVLTPGKSTPLSEKCLEQIGDNVQQVIAPASAHWIHLDEPDLVINSIREMVAAVSNEAVAAAG